MAEIVQATCNYCGHLYDVNSGFPVDGVCSLQCGIILSWEEQVTNPPDPVENMHKGGF